MGGGVLNWPHTTLHILLYSGLPSKLRVSSCSNTMDVTMVTRVGTLFAQFECASQLS